MHKKGATRRLCTSYDAWIDFLALSLLQFLPDPDDGLSGGTRRCLLIQALATSIFVFLTTNAIVMIHWKLRATEAIHVSVCIM